VLDRQLSRLITNATRRARGDDPLPWAIVAAVAYLLRRSLRHEERVESVRIKEGGEVTIALHERD
jgi:hypothetical protein